MMVFAVILLDAVLCFIDAGILFWIGSLIQAAGNAAGLGGVGSAFASILYACGAIVMVFGILFLVAALGFWTSRPWGYTLSFFMAILGMIWGFLGLGNYQYPASLAISVLLLVGNFLALYFLTRPEIKVYFGKR